MPSSVVAPSLRWITVKGLLFCGRDNRRMARPLAALGDSMTSVRPSPLPKLHRGEPVYRVVVRFLVRQARRVPRLLVPTNLRYTLVEPPTENNQRAHHHMASELQDIGF
jgi:hypothetical protein